MAVSPIQILNMGEYRLVLGIQEQSRPIPGIQGSCDMEKETTG